MTLKIMAIMAKKFLKFFVKSNVAHFVTLRFEFDNFQLWKIVLGVGQVGFWSSQAKSSIFENQNFKFKYCSSQILAKSSRVKY